MSNAAPETGLVLSSKLYDRLKFIALVILPGLVPLVIAAGDIFEIANAAKVAALIGALDLFLGGILKKSSSTFNENTVSATPVGDFVVTTAPSGKKTVTFELDQDPEDFVDGDVLSFVLREKSEEPEEFDEEPRGENLP